ncbi:MAG: hypothetical protein ACUBOA_11300 [Candidatus Loosdrechtia sp.]|uniref:hypothetical protein n=1 Tax=Candidatus Loosdrechtia sp. TaxID=3101272 RepID=UPI003A75CBA2|nr:MAG: hypothetical protein QY305_01765 [Candidatus Jettenia sp. AMX2]
MEQKLRAIVIIAMASFISIIAMVAFVRISNALDQLRGADLLMRCFSLWIKSIILTQSVLVVGGLFLFMLRKPKGMGNK